MAGEWPRVPISHVGTAVIRGTPSRSVADYWDDSIPWATAKDVTAVSGRYLEQVAECITEEKMARLVAQLREQHAEQDCLGPVIAAAPTRGKNHGYASDKGDLSRARDGNRI